MKVKVVFKPVNGEVVLPHIIECGGYNSLTNYLLWVFRETNLIGDVELETLESTWQEVLYDNNL